MFKNHLKIALRNILKNKLYSGINIGGLAVGLACAVLISMWVRDELSFDQFHQAKNEIYRINWDFKWNNNEGMGSGTPPPLAAALMNDVPDIAAATRIYPVPKQVVRYGENFFSEAHIFGVDQNFFEIFDFGLTDGDAKTALSQPNAVILTEEAAHKYFGGESPIGRIITIGEDQTQLGKSYQSAFKVSGVMKNPPHNSHFQFDMLTSISSHPLVEYFDWSWIWMRVTTYAKLAEGASAQSVEAAIPALVEKYAPPAFKRIGFSYDELLANGGRWDFLLQPLTDVYLGSSDIGNRLGPLGNRLYVYIFSIIAVFVVIMACINFMNLATARASKRAVEIGVRKVLGSKKSLFIRQFLSESTLFALLSLPAALLIVELFAPYFNQLSGKNLQLDLLNPLWFGPLLLLITVGVGVVAGSYPGFYLSSLNPAHVFKGPGGGSQVGRRRLRNFLVIFQFAITIGLIAGTFLVQDQLRFVQQADLGFDRGGLVAVSNENNRLGEQAEAFKEKIKTNANFLDASISTGAPPSWGFQDYYKVEGKGNEQFDLSSFMTDENFISTLGVEIVQGRGFSKEFGSDARSIILNEAAVQAFGLENPIGKIIHYPSTGDFEVIGVMKDFNFMSLYSPIAPFALFHHSSKTYQIPNSYVIVRVGSGDIENSLQTLRSEWQSFAPSAPFEFTFLDERFDAQYRSDQRLGQIFLIFSILTVFIACLGLLGLAAFAAEQRTNEIGVRKVLGATTTNVTALLSKDFVKLVLLANIIAWPITWYAMEQWLQEFAYRVEIGVGVFLMAGGLALLIAFFTVSFQAVRAATANPVDSLRYE